MPFRHYLDEIPFFGPIVIGTVFGELGHPGWFRTADDRLIQRVAEQDVTISVMRPEQALPLAQRPC